MPRLRLYDKNQVTNPQENSKVKKEAIWKVLLNLPAERHHHPSEIYHIFSQSNFSTRRMRQQTPPEWINFQLFEMTSSKITQIFSEEFSECVNLQYTDFFCTLMDLTWCDEVLQWKCSRNGQKKPPGSKSASSFFSVIAKSQQT